ncbi:uncharacterized protein LOC130741309 [Lotus japonicus]|uniref:uncharacterized protein LOC130741309 n=1 Tax=Lotus japonicus TaxID=34305 RepID=UPI002585ACD8|nr:uncharacterized protein LOC130741309 [Lotus japonicus]
MIRYILLHHSRPPPPLPPLKSKFPALLHSHHSFPIGLKPKPNFTCQAVFSDDAPFAAAIGACMLTSLLFPVTLLPVPEEEEDAITPTDARFAVMGIISFIPYFNWLSWVFAWLDTRKPRYAVFALVYLAPYLRTNLSISPEESWLPIASILFCIVHIQLEASIRNGDIQGFRLFRNIGDQPSSSAGKSGHLNQHEEMSEEGNKKGKQNLPPPQVQLRDIGDWDDSQRPPKFQQHLNEDLENDGE